MVDGRVRVEFTPTFMGCPALEAMRRRWRSAITRARSRASRSTSSSTTRGRPTGSPRGRREARAAGFAPPAPRERRDADAPPARSAAPFRCPWCGSTDTRLENVFGPTPCRSLRYCNALPPAVRAVQDDLSPAGPRSLIVDARRRRPGRARDSDRLCGRARRDLLLPRLKRLRPPGRESRGRAERVGTRAFAVEGAKSQYDVVADGSTRLLEAAPGGFPEDDEVVALLAEPQSLTMRRAGATVRRT